MGNLFTFLGEGLHNFRQTGALLPSSTFLADQMTMSLRPAPERIRVLEVGAGTGAITRKILAHLGPKDLLVIYEQNPAFRRCLEQLPRNGSPDGGNHPELRIVGKPIETIDRSERFDYVFSSLPLNNFDPERVDRILRLLTCLCREGGTLSYFEYVGMRALRRYTGGPAGRKRIRSLDRVLHRFLDGHQVERKVVVRNLPPAWVRHLRQNPGPD